MQKEKATYLYGQVLFPRINGQICGWDTVRYRKPGKRFYLREYPGDGTHPRELACLEYVKVGVIRATVTDDDHAFPEFTTFPEARSTIVLYLLGETKGRGEVQEMTETTTIEVAFRWKDLPQDLREELTKIEDRRAVSGFEFKGRRFFSMEFANDPDDFDPGYYTVLGLDKPLPDYLEGLPISCTARFPKLTTDIGSTHIYAHGMVRSSADDPLHVDLQGHSDNLPRLQHIAKALVNAIETMP